MRATAAVHILVVFLIAGFSSSVDGIGCYVCTSINGSDPRCEDSFHSYPEVYESSCFAARGTERSGKFPATTCIKLTAKKDNYTVMVRDCTLDNGGTTKDVEIGALNHCGWIRTLKYDEIDMKGCLTICETDGCNQGEKSKLNMFVFLATILVATIVID